MRGLGSDGIRRSVLLHCFTAIALAVSVAAQTQKPPVFRARTDLLQLDVTVLDKDGRPVRGLTKDDFVVIEDKAPQSIEGFTAVDIPDAPADVPAWHNTTAPDVVSNEIDNQRIFVLVIDDALSMGLKEVPPSQPRGGLGPLRVPDPWATREMKKSVALFIRTLGPADLAALVFTNETRFSQNLTADHARLIGAIEAYPEDGGGILIMSGQDPCLGQKYSVGTIQGVVNTLAAVPDRRKAVVYFGGELPWASGPDPCFTHVRWQETFASAQQAHVTINPVDTMGLRMSGVTGKADRYLTVAENTGGHAVVASSDFEPGIRQIFLENSSYYLLAYQPTNDVEDGTFRRIAVTVKNRPDVEVRTRRSYWAPKRKAGDAPPPEPPPQVEALAGILPLSALTLRATAVPFAVAGTDKAIVALAIGVRQPALAARSAEQVAVLVNAYTADGDPRGSQTDSIAVAVPAARGDEDESRYELLTRIELPKPGKYQIRLSAHSEISDTRGSVYVDVEVPVFRKDAVSLSGVVLSSALPAAPIAPGRALRDLTPLVPTTERTFTTTDFVTAFVRVYQGGGGRLAAIPLQAQVRDAAGTVVAEETASLEAGAFGDERSADYQFRLPLATLAAGEYLLTIQAAQGKVTARRDVRFRVR